MDLLVTTVVDTSGIEVVVTDTLRDGLDVLSEVDGTPGVREVRHLGIGDSEARRSAHVIHGLTSHALAGKVLVARL